MVRGLANRFPEYGIDGEVYVTAPGAEIDEAPPADRRARRRPRRVFGAHCRARRHALVLGRIRPHALRHRDRELRQSSGLLDTVKGENLEIDGLVKTAEVYARAGHEVCRASMSNAAFGTFAGKPCFHARPFC